MKYELSKKDILKEIVKCGKNPSYFLSSYAKISHPVHGLIPFNTYDYQDDLLDDFIDYRFNIILKARQLGISTIVAGYVAWMMIFHRDKNVLILATKLATATNLVKKVKAIVKKLPRWLQIADINIDNRTSFELTNGSQIKASSTSGDAGRSEALSLLVIDEAAHIDTLGDLWKAIYPTISTGGRCVALSSPNGVGNWFHKTYVGAEDASNEFHATKLIWDVHPDRDQAWFEKETKNMARREIAQEYECNFNTSGETVIDPADLGRLYNECKKPKYRSGFDRNYWIWENYNEEFTYLVVADVARGDGADNSVFHVLKLQTLEIVAEYQGKPTLDMYANFLYQVGNEYGKALLVVENIGIGISVLEKLNDLGYTNLYYSMKGSHDYVEYHMAQNLSNAVPGFSTTTKTRPLIVAKLEEYIRNKLIKIYSTRLVNELKTFVWSHGKPQAMRSYNDDLVMALAICCWVRDTALEEDKRQIEYKKSALASIIRSDSLMNTSIPGMEGYKKEYDSEKTIREYQEHIWLLKG